jgi:hypothetical protein
MTVTGWIWIDPIREMAKGYKKTVGRRDESITHTPSSDSFYVFLSAALSQGRRKMIIHTYFAAAGAGSAFFSRKRMP